MLLGLLKSLARSVRRTAQPAGGEYPIEQLKRRKDAHRRAPIAAHLEILYRDLRVGDRLLNDLLAECVARSEVEIPPLKAFRRPLASYFLARYFLRALDIEGGRAECGVFQGTSALFMCRAAQSRLPHYDGEGLHLIDSFEGLSTPSEEDRFTMRGAADGRPVSHSLPQSVLAAPLERAQAALRDFPGVSFHRGWVPQVFEHLPDTRWSFVHVDLDLHAPTLASLEYFYPKLAAGGVIICDDYGSPAFPGAHRAWDSFCELHDVPYVVLDTGQSVILMA